MKNLLLFSSFLALTLFLVQCQPAPTPKDIINDQFPEDQAAITQILDDIYKSAQAKDLEKLASFHWYGPKFSDFKDGLPRGNAEQNKQSEQAVFSAVSNLEYDLRDVKVDVFGDVAVATFHGYFEGDMGENHVTMQLQGTLVFAKTDKTWKIVHEHFSPLNPANPI